MSRNLLKNFLSHHRTKKFIVQSLGWFFIFLGVIGLFLPILQGVLFLAVGVALLANHNPFFRRIRDRVYHRYPKLKKMVRREHARLRLFFRGLRHRFARQHPPRH